MNRPLEYGFRCGEMVNVILLNGEELKGAELIWCDDTAFQLKCLDGRLAIVYHFASIVQVLR